MKKKLEPYWLRPHGAHGAISSSSFFKGPPRLPIGEWVDLGLELSELQPRLPRLQLAEEGPSSLLPPFLQGVARDGGPGMPQATDQLRLTSRGHRWSQEMCGTLFRTLGLILAARGTGGPSTTCCNSCGGRKRHIFPNLTRNTFPSVYFLFSNGRER